MEESCHIPVMQSEVLEYLAAERGGDFLDCTVGGGGHTAAILESNPRNHVLGVDCDQRAVQRVQDRLQSFGERLRLQQCSFGRLEVQLREHKFDGVLADLGISSDQLRENRGFAFSDAGAFDMRMGGAGRTAAEVVNDSSERELYALLKRGGVGGEARAIVGAVKHERPIRTAEQFARVVNRALAGKLPSKRTNPCTVAFQAVRMEVNQELDELNALLEAAPRLVRDRGRLVVISFHSLEERVIASRLREWEGRNIPPALWPGAVEGESKGTLLTRKAVCPQSTEVESNPRARSARLRAFEFSVH